MEPRIQYAKTEDGVSIAFWVFPVSVHGTVYKQFPMDTSRLALAPQW